MRSRYLQTILVAGLAAALGIGGAPAGERAKAGPRDKGQADQKPAAVQTATIRPTLDELTLRAEGGYKPDGTIHWMRTFKHAIPWEEYMAAISAERTATPVPNAGAPGTIIVDDGGGAGEGGGGTVLTTCVPPDSDYDGDGFTLNTNPPDTFPLRRGEYVADRPRIKAFFTSFIEADIAYKLTGQTEFLHEIERVDESSLTVLTTTKDTREFKKKFNGSFGIKLGLGLGQKPTLGLDLGLGGETERTETSYWSRETTNRVSQTYKELKSRKDRSEITVGPNDGWVRGQATMYNLSDYALDANVSNVRVAVILFSPFTGDKSVLGDVSVSGSFILGFGAGNNSASTTVELPGINTLYMMERLGEGWIFDMEIASFSATDMATGQNLTSRISQVNQRNSRTSIHYGDATPRQYGQVAVFQPGDTCLTGKDLLTQYAGAANVEFDRLADGTLVVKRINHRTNRFADRNFDTLTPQEQAQYGRWVVGFDYYTQPLTDFDLETTLLAPEDKIFFYYLTAADFVETEPPADVTVNFSLANDGSAPSSALITPVSVGQTVELRVDSDFQIMEAYSQYMGNIYYAGCGTIYSATYFGRRVATDSNLHNITVPNVDWYGLQVDFGGLGWRTLASIIADPASGGAVTSFRGFPYYDYVVRFRVTPAMLGTYPTRNLQLRSANARQTFSIGYEGYNVLGQRVVCRWNVTDGFYRNHGDTLLWYDLGAPDADRDGFYAASATGIDFDDANNRRFPYAPEHLDGINNDGDALIDEEPMLCPTGLRSGDNGTCTLDNRMGWYPASPNIALQRRFRRTDGTFTSWESAGSGTTYAFTMTSDPAASWMEVKATYYPAGGGSYSGTNVINHLPGSAEVPLFNTGVDFEAEAGRIVAPMQAGTVGPDTFVHVPSGTNPYAGASADYRINVTQAGTYHIWTRVYASSSADDSLFVGLYDPAGQPVTFGFGPEAHFRLERVDPAYAHGAFGWTRVGHWNAYTTPEELVIPIPYPLVPGIYTLKFRPRELGTRLDKIRVDRYCPDADGDGYTTCAGDCNDANPNIRPSRGEVCSTPYDDDCDGYVNEGCGGSGSAVLKKRIPVEEY